MQIGSFKSIVIGMIFVCATLASSAIAAPADLPAVTQQAQDIGICAAPTSWAKTNKVLTCTCPANFNISTSLWGTDIYTADSYICTTALHASVLDRSGGRVTIEMLPGQNSYAGTKRNGVSTRSYGKYTASYRFVNPSTTSSGEAAASATGKKDGARNPLEKGAAALLSDIGAHGLEPAADKPAGENIGECHGATKWRGTGKTLICTCPANFSIKGSIWGTDVYTDDSYICKAALHAGRIGRSGGPVSIHMIDGQSSYAGTRRNGVISLSYRRNAGSYRFN